ncbi:hypothetical protein FIBSPDRAFT_860547 [Athelia psychrophila]|uniref:Galactose oxidase n=1 Tax=Athelia psychrophila TaxID=1759441 RepID=A0A166K7E5_9AGAM|nr:hypothetical protein FIBSPDRAFT_860547 [Fibularhizoctonia sp. CBS 109695]
MVNPYAVDRGQISRDQYMADRDAKTRGTENPSIMDKPFWIYMIENGVNGWTARHTFGECDEADIYEDETPIWCFARFGQTHTELPDGRIVHIAGEHEDSYDPDFAIYNDVVVQSPARPLSPGEDEVINDTPKPTYTIYGYPVEMFPPTDFHSATYYSDGDGEYIFVIGGLGYVGQASRSKTEVYRLHLNDFSMERMETSGHKKPTIGLCHHSAELSQIDGEAAIKVSWYGNASSMREKENAVPREVFHLVIKDMRWI